MRTTLLIQKISSPPSPSATWSYRNGRQPPFALAAGLSGAGSSTSIIVTADLIEGPAGATAMGPGRYLAGRKDAEHYRTKWQREMADTGKFRKSTNCCWNTVSTRCGQKM